MAFRSRWQQPDNPVATTLKCSRCGKDYSVILEQEHRASKFVCIHCRTIQVPRWAKTK